MSISDDCDKIIKGLEATYALNGVNGLENLEARYLGATMETFDVKKTSSGEE